MPVGDGSLLEYHVQWPDPVRSKTRRLLGAYAFVARVGLPTTPVRSTGVGLSQTHVTYAVRDPRLYLPQARITNPIAIIQYVPTPAPVVGVVPVAPVDTIRGGVLLAITSPDALLDTSRDVTFRGLNASATWPVTTVGTGTRVTPTTTGLMLATGPAPGSSVTATSSDSYRAFDVAIDVDVDEAARRLATPVELATLELESPLGWIARVQLRSIGGVIGATGSVTVPADGPLVAGATVVPPERGSAKWTLRFVRVGTRLLGYVGLRSEAVGDEPLPAYAASVLVLDFDSFTTEDVSVRFGVRNLLEAQRIGTRFSNFTVRSHALIARRPLDDKIDHGLHRVLGNVPEASLEDVGFVDMTVFGLMGTAVVTDGFEYVLPPERTLARGAGGQLLFTVQEPVAKDGK